MVLIPPMNSMIDIVDVRAFRLDDHIMTKSSPHWNSSTIGDKTKLIVVVVRSSLHVCLGSSQRWQNNPTKHTGLVGVLSNGNTLTLSQSLRMGNQLNHHRTSLSRYRSFINFAQAVMYFNPFLMTGISWKTLWTRLLVGDVVDERKSSKASPNRIQ